MLEGHGQVFRVQVKVCSSNCMGRTQAKDLSMQNKFTFEKMVRLGDQDQDCSYRTLVKTVMCSYAS